MKSQRPHMRGGASIKKGSASTLMRTIFILALTIAASALISSIFVIFYNYILPSIMPFFFEVIPSFWSFFCQSFTPINLFILLNLIILSIFAIAHLHNPHVPAPPDATTIHLHSRHQVPPSSSSLQSAGQDENTIRVAADRAISEEGINVDGHEKSRHSTLSYEHEVETICCSSQHIGIAALVEENDDHNTEPSTDYSSFGEDADEYGDDDQLLVQVTSRINTVTKEVKEDQTNILAEGVDDDQNMVILLGNSSLQQPKQGTKCDHPHPAIAEQGTKDNGAEQSRPLPSERFLHKKVSKLANTGRDRSLSPSRISRPIGKSNRAGDTLESTWKAICESKRHSSPLNNHVSRSQHILRKQSSGTRGMKAMQAHDEGPINHVHKVSPMNIQSPSLLSPLRQRPKLKEPSIPQEELNAKVEAFISNFFERNRIQREKSMLEYMEMVRRGAK